MIHTERIRILKKTDSPAGDSARYVLYWMQAAQRVAGNHALTFAIRQANKLRLPVVVCFGLTGEFPEANLRHYTFMLQGLWEVERELAARGIRFILLMRPPPDAALALAAEAALVVTDRGYLRIQKQWREAVAAGAPCPAIQVETEVIVPVEVVSTKEEYAAATLRRKITPCLEHYLQPLTDTAVEKTSLEMELNVPAALDFARPNVFPAGEAPSRRRRPSTFRGSRPPGMNPVDEEIAALLAGLGIDHSVPPVSSFRGGEAAASQHLHSFIENRLARYREAHNDPAGDGASHLSPYLHFGQISPLIIALAVMNSEGITQAEKDSFLEELIVRRELSMNFVHYHPAYDAFACLPAWAVKTLSCHAGDERPYRYRPEDLEGARTHDPYWNAAQKEMLYTGKMNNYMRMYWGKKIIEWSATPQEAFYTALYLNNKYALDGRDPNSYAGVAWCFGKHDRPWGERNIFGQVRYMNAAGLRRKFNMEQYVGKVENMVSEQC